MKSEFSTCILKIFAQFFVCTVNLVCVCLSVSKLFL